jgi:hypothetical protein
MCIIMMDYVNYVKFWKCSVAMCNITLNNYIVGYDNCEHRYCEECWLCHNVAIKTITIHVIEVVISITTIITYLHKYI